VRGTVLYAAGDVRIENVPDPMIQEPSDAVIRVTRACICGSDLWPYQSLKPEDGARVMGHEADSGTVTAGKRAAHVILDADPLASIGAVRQVHLVIAAGRAFAPAPLWQTAGFAAPSSR